MVSRLDYFGSTELKSLPVESNVITTKMCNLNCGIVERILEVWLWGKQLPGSTFSKFQIQTGVTASLLTCGMREAVVHTPSFSLLLSLPLAPPLSLSLSLSLHVFSSDILNPTCVLTGHEESMRRVAWLESAEIWWRGLKQNKRRWWTEAPVRSSNTVIWLSPQQHHWRSDQATNTSLKTLWIWFSRIF